MRARCATRACLALLAGGQGGQRGALGVGMNRLERELFVDEASLGRVGLEGLMDDRFGARTERALVVRELDDRDRAVGGAFDGRGADRKVVLLVGVRTGLTRTRVARLNLLR